MTKDERQLVAGLLHAIDAILEGLAHGEGVDHWWQFFAAWTAEGEQLRQRLQAEWKREPDSDDERGEDE